MQQTGLTDRQCMAMRLTCTFRLHHVGCQPGPPAAAGADEGEGSQRGAGESTQRTQVRAANTAVWQFHRLGRRRLTALVLTAGLLGKQYLNTIAVGMLWSWPLLLDVLAQTVAVLCFLCRWRKLEGSDPSTYEMIQKIQTLQKRLISKTEEVVEKDLLIQVGPWACCSDMHGREWGSSTADRCASTGW